MRSPSRRCPRERKNGSVQIKAIGTECISDPGCTTFQFCWPLIHTHTPPHPQTEPATVASWVWRGAVILLADAKKA